MFTVLCFLVCRCPKLSNIEESEHHYNRCTIQAFSPTQVAFQLCLLLHYLSIIGVKSQDFLITIWCLHTDLLQSNGQHMLFLHWAAPLLSWMPRKLNKKCNSFDYLQSTYFCSIKLCAFHHEVWIRPDFLFQIRTCSSDPIWGMGIGNCECTLDFVTLTLRNHDCLNILSYWVLLFIPSSQWRIISINKFLYGFIIYEVIPWSQFLYCSWTQLSHMYSSRFNLVDWTYWLLGLWFLN